MTVALPAGINELLRRDHCRWLLIGHQRSHSNKRLNIDRFRFFPNQQVVGPISAEGA